MLPPPLVSPRLAFFPPSSSFLEQEPQEPTPQEKQAQAAKTYKKLKKGELEKVGDWRRDKRLSLQELG